MAAAALGEEEFAEVELEVAAILCGVKRILRARDRRRRRRQRQEAPEIPRWGRRRLRSVLEDSKPAAAVDAVVAERDDDGAASPDTPLAFPESGGDDAPPEPEDGAKKARTHHEWVQEQHGVVASLSQENLHLLKQIELYRARLQSSRSTSESLKQLHKVREEQEQEQALKLRVMAQRQGAAAARADPLPVSLGLDLNEPARAPEGEEAAARARAMVAAEWYRQGQQRAALQKAAATAEARRRRLEILRAKVASPLVSSRMRRMG